MTTCYIPEAARILGCSRETVRKYILDGTLKGAYRNSGGWRGCAWNIPEHEVYALLENKKKAIKRKSDIPTSKEMETKRIAVALDEMDAAIMLLHETISKLRMELE